jgi:hypothetical protein
VKLTGTARQKRGMFGESTSPVDNVPSDAPLCGHRNCTEQGVLGQRVECSNAVRLAVRNEANLVGHARPPSKLLLNQGNKANVHSSANAGVDGSFAQLGRCDGSYF